jgi:uncharacterized protein (TIGR00255 family)
MIRSMTGYGKAEAIVDSTPTTIEVRSVNGRYLELSCRLPKEWAEHESAVRDAVRQAISRGSVNVFIRREDAPGAQSLFVDKALAIAYVEQLRTLRDELGLIGEVSVDHLASYAPIFQGEAPGEVNENVWSELSGILGTALDAINAMREREGVEMGKDLEARLQSIASGLEEVERRSLERIPAERERLRERVRQVVEDENIDEQRLALEITLLADKLDVSEECVRLRSHIKHFRDDMKSGGAIGRKLNFQLQEMNREVNTIGSKTNDADIARIVVGMKEELERMREQVQNIE